ncbi:MAG: hypothetical protein AB4352_28475, partial [Hormoscilla sp.]
VKAVIPQLKNREFPGGVFNRLIKFNDRSHVCAIAPAINRVYRTMLAPQPRFCKETRFRSYHAIAPSKKPGFY